MSVEVASLSLSLSSVYISGIGGDHSILSVIILRPHKFHFHSFFEEELLTNVHMQTEKGTQTPTPTHTHTHIISDRQIPFQCIIVSIELVSTPLPEDPSWDLWARNIRMRVNGKKCIIF